MLWLLLPLLAASAPVTVGVARSPLAEPLRSRLERELPADALVPAEAATAIARLTREAGGLRLRLERRGGRLVIDRRIDVGERGEDAALRVAVLLVADAYRALVAPGSRAAPVAPTRTSTVEGSHDAVVTTRTTTVAEASREPDGATRTTTAAQVTEAVAAPAVAASTGRRGAPRTSAEPSNERTSVPAEARGADDVASTSAERPRNTPATAPDAPSSAAPDAPSSAASSAAPDAASSAANRSLSAPSSAISPTEEAAATPGAEARAARPGRTSVTFAGTGSWWQRPGAALLGLQLGAHRRVQQLTFGLRADVGGLCCHLELPDPERPGSNRLEADVLRIGLLAEVSLRAFATGALTFSPAVAIGAEYTWADVTATAFAGDPVVETHRALSGLVRAGLRLDWALGARFGLEAAAGIVLRSPRLVSRLPEPFTTEEPDLDAGLVGPWLEVGARFSPF